MILDFSSNLFSFVLLRKLTGFFLCGFCIQVSAQNSFAQASLSGKKPNVVSGAQINRKVDREGFYDELKNEFEKSLKKVEYQRVEKSVKLENELAKTQDPWTLSNAVKWSDYTVYPKFQETTDTLTLKYENQRGFSFQTYIDYYNSSEFPNYNQARYSRNNYGASFSQDIFMWFRKTAFDLNQEITEISGKSKLFANESSYLGDILMIVDWSYQLFSSVCKRKDLDRILKLAQDTLRTSEVQQAARTISMRDLLRIKATYIGLQRQIASADYEILSAQGQFAAISQASFEKAKALSSAALFCEEDLEKLKSSAAPSRQEMLTLIAKHPSMLSLEVSKESLKKKFDLYKTNQNHKLTLTGGYDRTNNVEYRDPYDQKFIGVTWSYNFQGDNFNAYKQTIAEQFQDLSVQQKVVQLELSQYLNSIFDQIDYQRSQIPIVSEMILNAERLISIIETQQSIGQLDATAIESAVQSEIQSQSEKRSLWSQISSNALKIAEIKKASERAADLR